MSRAGTLVVVDLPAPGRSARLIRRLLGSGLLDWASLAGRPWLVLAPPGDGGDRSWCRGSTVLELVDVLDRESRRDLVEDVVRVSNALIAGLEPGGPGLPPAILNRGFIQGWVYDLMTRERAVVSACRSLGLGLCRILSTSRTRARWLSAGVRASGLDARALGLPDRHRRAPRSRLPGRWTLAEPQVQAELLLVAESAPMAEMFAAVTAALPESIHETTLQLSYGSAAGRGGTSDVRQAQPRWLEGASSERPAGSPAPLVAVPNPPLIASPLQEAIPVSVRESLGALHSRLRGDWIPRLEPWALHVQEVLRQVRPRVLVVGNDRFWSGQTFIRLARQQGVVTVCIQDGIGSEEPDWTYSSAEHLLASGSLWPRLLARFGSGGQQVAVVGQPRYDGQFQRARALRAGVAESGEGGTGRVLLVLQEIHGPDYAKAVVEEILRMEGAEVLIRPHPAHRPTEFQGLRQPRVRVGESDDIESDLAWADLVITEYSTVAVEALALGLPVLSVTLSGRPSVLDFSVPGQAESVGRKSAISAAVARLLAGTGGPDTTDRRGTLLDELVGPLDGSSAARVAEIVGGLLQQPVSA